MTSDERREKFRALRERVQEIESLTNVLWNDLLALQGELDEQESVRDLRPMGISLVPIERNNRKVLPAVPMEVDDGEKA